VRDYAPGSPERASLKQRLSELDGQQIEIPMIIGGEEVRTGTTAKSVKPHAKHHVLAEYHKGRRRTGRAGDRGGPRRPQGLVAHLVG
jgi:hypothetical protein